MLTSINTHITGTTNGQNQLQEGKSCSKFLLFLNFSHVPQELIKSARGREVSLTMEDHRDEEYVQKRQAMKAFGGEGHTLGR